MLRLALLLCVLAGCGRQPPPPKLGSGSTSAPGSTAEPASRSEPALRSEPSTAPAQPSTAPAPPCDPSECGPPMRMPNRRCPDGSIGGPTGQCLREPDGRCAWEI